MRNSKESGLNIPNECRKYFSGIATKWRTVKFEGSPKNERCSGVLSPNRTYDRTIAIFRSERK
jgi:hypothetical protein